MKIFKLIPHNMGNGQDAIAEKVLEYVKDYDFSLKSDFHDQEGRLIARACKELNYFSVPQHGGLVPWWGDGSAPPPEIPEMTPRDRHRAARQARKRRNVPPGYTRRPGGGRKKAAPSVARSELIAAAVEPRLKAYVEHVAEEMDTTVSRFMRQLVVAYRAREIARGRARRTRDDG